jgi:hypothetical protein
MWVVILMIPASRMSQGDAKVLEENEKVQTRKEEREARRLLNLQ